MRPRTTSLLIIVLLISMSTVGCGWVLNQIRWYDDENVPPPADFDRVLKHDLTEYVTNEGDINISVTYELLRDVPSQSGVALPKFYVWVEKHAADGTVVEQAATRIAAYKRTHFDIIQYFDIDQIRKDPTILNGVFPADVVKKVRQKVGLNEDMNEE